MRPSAIGMPHAILFGMPMPHRQPPIGGKKKPMKKVVSTLIATAFALGLSASGYAQAPAGTEKKGVEQSQPSTKSETPAVKTETPGAKTEPGAVKTEKKGHKHGKKAKKSEAKTGQSKVEQPQAEEKTAK